ncbi:hypothetical protein DICPUDRAFT_95315 [Dictyostelium purpureum]|uniref:USP domain-containing protein n=1 Tax=Dictyostelium purpureum TaxID=5786 RepID=F0ZUW2_DICPU|nr:uncharacterized protein DICPUDRAFT_95315 [Dictyostelium purpureum]EGC32265.1 hypothetical protein DICPUDRAFT_95315 [Dictyostelium purpureum]|eukprot:XP_003291202.1 hypothetical protein DICPUDRAFT_95315 [Dictyostelium purpureum]
MFGNLYEGDDDINNEGFIGPQLPGPYNSNNYNGKKYLRKPIDKRSDHGFVGLLNQGATCYLNSLIQMLYMTPELKNNVYKLTIDDFGISELIEKREKELLNKSNNDQTIENNNSSDNNINNNENNNDNNQDSFNQILGTESNNVNSNNSNKIESEEKLLSSEYAQELLLVYGLERERLVDALKLYPTQDQIERLMDWYYSDAQLSSSYSGNTGNSNCDSGNIVAAEGIDPLFGDYSDAFNSMEFETYPSPNSSYKHLIETPLPPTDNSKAIVLFDEASTLNHFTGETKNNTNEDSSSTTTTTTTTTSTTKTASSSTTTTTTNKKKGRVIPYELQRLFSMLQKGNVYAMSTEDLTKSFGWTSDQSFHQQDIHELNRILFDAVEHSIKKTPIENLFSDLYKGSFVNRLTCTECGMVKDRMEFFQDIPVTVKGFSSIEESLNSFTSPETLDGKNMYSCDSCNKKVVATFQVKLGKVPPILIFALRRFDYDFSRGTRVKLHNRFEFPQDLDMKPYIIEDNNSASGENEKENDGSLDYELFSVLIHSGGAFGGHYHSYIKDVLNIGGKKEENIESTNNTNNDEPSSDSNITNNLTTESAESTTATDDTAATESQGENGKDNSDDNKFSGWYDFNDSSVLPIKDSVVKKQFGGSDECAYMLIYRSKKLRNNLEIYDIPLHFEKEIKEFNEGIERDRAEYEVTANSMFLTPKFQENIVIHDGIIYNNNNSKNNNKEVELLQLDISSTTEDLYKLITSKFPDEVESILSNNSSGIVIQEMFTKDGKVGLQPPIVPSSTTNIKKVGLREGSQILIWKGADKSNIPIRFNIKYFYNNPDDVENYLIKNQSLSISRESTYQKLKEIIHGSISDVCTTDNLNKLILYQLPNQTLLPFEDDYDMPLSNRLYSDITLYVEVLPNGFTCADDLDHTNSLVKKDFELNKSKIQLFVNDRFKNISSSIVSVSSAPPVRILSDPKNTIYQLKEIIFDTLYPNEKKEWIDQTVIRKTLVGGYEGTIISDDTLTLKEANIVNTSLIIFEKGQSSKSTLTIKYIHGVDKKPAHPEPRLLTDVSKNTTIMQLKKDILSRLKISEEIASRYILRLTDIFEGPNNIIVEEDMTIEEVGVKSLETLWIEEGVIPAKDQIIIKISLYQMNNVSQILGVAASPILHLNQTYNPIVPDLFTIIPIGDLSVDKKLTLSQLKDKILNWDLFLKQSFINKEEQDIRIWLEEKLLTTCNKPITKFNIYQESTVTIEVYNKDLESKSSVSDLEEGENTHSHHKVSKPLLLYIHKRRPLEQSFEYPPKQLIFNGKTIKDLYSFISTNFGVEEQFLHLFKYFPNYKSNPWRVIEERVNTNNKKSNTKEVANENNVDTNKPNQIDNNINNTQTSSIRIAEDNIEKSSFEDENQQNVTTSTTETTPSVAATATSEDSALEEDNESTMEKATNNIPLPPPPPQKKKDQTQNNLNNSNNVIVDLRGKPFMLKDGDIIAYLDTRDDPEHNDRFALAMNNNSNSSGQKSSVYFGSSYLGSNNKKYRAQEVELKIELDDF